MGGIFLAEGRELRKKKTSHREKADQQPHGCMGNHLPQIQDQIRHLLSSPKDQYREDSRCRSDQPYDQDDHCGMFVIRHSVPLPLLLLSFPPPGKEKNPYKKGKKSPQTRPPGPTPKEEEKSTEGGGPVWTPPAYHPGPARQGLVAQGEKDTTCAPLPPCTGQQGEEKKTPSHTPPAPRPRPRRPPPDNRDTQTNRAVPENEKFPETKTRSIHIHLLRTLPYAKYQKCHHDGKGGVQRGLKN